MATCMGFNFDFQAITVVFWYIFIECWCRLFPQFYSRCLIAGILTFLHDLKGSALSDYGAVVS